jgi:hypothetical protein
MPVTAAPQQGHGATITFSSSFFAWILDISPASMKREALETTNNATTTQRTFRPEQLCNNGELRVTIQFDAAKTPPITSAAETVTITFPMAAGAATASNWAGSAFLTSFDPSAPMNGIMTATATLKWAGAITVTPAA